ncbi:MAG: hypothetical protein M3Y60_12740, partial [Bacteroidota bacterium]|nr:hypothetical protein [Bacteroidota bacterium]
MRRLYRIIIYLGSFLCSFLLTATFSFGQCPDRTVTPASATICSGSTVSVTIQNSDVTNFYRLEDTSDNPLSGFFQGTGGNLTIISTPISSPVTIEVTAASLGGCLIELSQDIPVTIRQLPTPADAGVDQLRCLNNTFTLAGNAPAVGTGAWSIIGPANGAVITTPGLRNSTVTGLTLGASVTLRWTISNAPCASSSDDVVLTYSGIPPAAAAGSDQALCNTSIFTLAANAAGPGAGTWTIQGAANG